MSNPNDFRLLAIVGQTAAGKSSLAMRVATATAAEIVAADSKTVYKGLDIGTAKPTTADRRVVKHHLLDVVSPGEVFNVAQFQAQALSAIELIVKSSKLPILVGGSGLYADSVLLDYDFSSHPAADPELRQRLQALSVVELQAEIKRRQLPMPQNQANRRYLIRCLERGDTSDAKRDLQWRPGALAVGLRHSKEVLERRIRERLGNMLQAGLLDEARWVYENCSVNSEAAKSNIYAALRSYFGGQLKLEEALEDFVRRDLALAKKQLTWFKRHSQIRWFGDSQAAYEYIVANLKTS